MKLSHWLFILSILFPLHSFADFKTGQFYNEKEMGIDDVIRFSRLFIVISNSSEGKIVILTDINQGNQANNYHVGGHVILNNGGIGHKETSFVTTPTDCKLMQDYFTQAKGLYSQEFNKKWSIKKYFVNHIDIRKDMESFKLILKAKCDSDNRFHLYIENSKDGKPLNKQSAVFK